MSQSSARSSVMTGLLLMAVLLSASSAVFAQDDEKIPTEAEAQAICARFAGYKPGPEARATDQDRKAFSAKSADCTGYVYDTGEGTNRDKGRRCCLVHGDCNRELGMIFANGWGVHRDYDAATYFLCHADGEMAPFEQWEMLGHVETMRKAGQPKDLDFCDYAESGYGTSWCAQLDLARRSVDWERRVAAVRPSLGAAAPSLAALRKAADTFIEANAEAEAADSLGGTIYPTLVLGSQASENEAFVANLERFGRQRADTVPPETLKTADAALNAAYKAAMGREEFTDDHALSESLRAAQRTWLHYRDAWIAFYRLRWKDAAPPDALDREITAALTAQRTAELKKLMDEG
jgi:uncharacterized protein YecT (DUF1311 family)